MSYYVLAADLSVWQEGFPTEAAAKRAAQRAANVSGCIYYWGRKEGVLLDCVGPDPLDAPTPDRLRT